MHAGRGCYSEVDRRPLVSSAQFDTGRHSEINIKCPDGPACRLTSGQLAIPPLRWQRASANFRLSRRAIAPTSSLDQPLAGLREPSVSHYTLGRLIQDISGCERTIASLSILPCCGSTTRNSLEDTIGIISWDNNITLQAS